MSGATEAFWNSQLQNQVTVPDYDAWDGRFTAMSQAPLGRWPGERSATGPDAMQALWRHPTGRRDRALVFIHGGYWRRFAASDFGFVAETAAAADAVFYNVDYRLMPAVRMADVVADTVAACELAISEVEHAVIVGHSAGAHLAAEAAIRMKRPPAAVVAISGLYELDPLRFAFIQDELNLTEEDVANYSPQSRAREVRCPIHVIAGAEETVEFCRQSARFHDALASAGLPTTFRLAQDRHHLSVVADLADPTSALAREVATLLER